MHLPVGVLASVVLFCAAASVNRVHAQAAQQSNAMPSSAARHVLTQQGEFQGDVAAQVFGRSVAIDGDTAVVAAPCRASHRLVIHWRSGLGLRARWIG
jgi:predicted permease